MMGSNVWVLTWIILMNNALVGIYCQEPTDAHLDMSGLLEQYGYPHSVHFITTKDGYILKCYRIQKCNSENLLPIVLLHGIFNNSKDFIALGVGKALGYLLADQCYDTWILNSRGNFESRNHTTMDPDEPAFWDFSFSEIGKYDLPATFRYVLEKSGKNKLNYVGHSQGTGAFFVYASLHPIQSGRIINQMHALAPALTLHNTNSLFYRTVGLNFDESVTILDGLSIHELLPRSKLVSDYAPAICNDEGLSFLCQGFEILASGNDPEQYNKTVVAISFADDPAGTSTKSFLHLCQLTRTERFQNYDYRLYGKNGNWRKYGQRVPPEYPVGLITVPIFIYYGEGDVDVTPTDVERSSRRLQNASLHKVAYPKFGHQDFVFADNAKEMVYDIILERLKN